jgi:hypothetical protein
MEQNTSLPTEYEENHGHIRVKVVYFISKIYKFRLLTKLLADE